MRNLIITGLILIFTSCNNNSISEFTDVKVKEVEKVGSYTYLYVKAKGPAYWIAVPTMDAAPGDSYHYQGGMWMTDFYSQELDKTFDKVLFLESIFAGTSSSGQGSQVSIDPGMMQAPHGAGHGGKVDVEKSKVEIEAAEGALSLADLFSDPKAYEGKSIRVTGEVVKYNEAIMSLNWIHIQDGTEFEGKFDLTSTSTESFKVGSVVTIEGVLALNKDFGYGYNYEVLLEQATAVE